MSTKSVRSLPRSEGRQHRELSDLVIVELRNEGWEIVSLDDALCRFHSDDPSRRFAVLTFDDGYRM